MVKVGCCLSMRCVFVLLCVVMSRCCLCVSCVSVFGLVVRKVFVDSKKLFMGLVGDLLVVDVLLLSFVLVMKCSWFYMFVLIN